MRPKKEIVSPSRLRELLHYNQQTGEFTWVLKNKMAPIQIGSRRIHLGSFKTEKEAQAAYFGAAQKYKGEFARAK